MSNRLDRPVPPQAEHFAGGSGPVPRRLRSRESRSSPVPPNCTGPYKPSRGLDAKRVQHDVSRRCRLLQ
ncbi:hypothetical protein DY000_02019535 [Brassica cretica]|uniref:Uncharacterized protein n=1 Tax=Brassica cretica TaxID=69181 RepID=A0ABQ7CZQ6_BRACR|nr:hypothetical protein DY000_02019535 [Brassica cretica]